MRQVFVPFLFGVLAAAALPHAGWIGFVYDLTPYSFPLFAVAVSVLFHATTKADTTRFHAFGASFFFMLGYFVFGLNWIGNALLVPGNDYAWAWPLAVVGLPILLAPFLAIVMAATAPFLSRMPLGARMISFSAAFTGAEYARGHLFTGFPWNLPGMFWAETLPLFQILSLVGIYGLTFLTLFWSVALGELVRSVIMRHRVQGVLAISIAALSFLGLFAYGMIKPPAEESAQTLQAVLVQASIPQSEKWNADKMMDHFYQRMAMSARPENINDAPTLIIWPETALPDGMLNAPIIQSQIKSLLATYPKGSMLITGFLDVVPGPDGPRYYNSIAAVNGEGQAQKIYDKHHLVPFGEYIPFQSYIPLAPVARFTGMQAGQGQKTVSLPGFPSFSPLVCYEVAFTRQVVTGEDKRPTFILNLTNDSWFGDSPGPYQHLMEARARAIEESAPLIRVSENGISAALATDGRLLTSLSHNQKGSSVIHLSFR